MLHDNTHARKRRLLTNDCFYAVCYAVCNYTEEDHSAIRVPEKTTGKAVSCIVS